MEETKEYHTNFFAYQQRVSGNNYTYPEVNGGRSRDSTQGRRQNPPDPEVFYSRGSSDRTGELTGGSYSNPQTFGYPPSHVGQPYSQAPYHPSGSISSYATTQPSAGNTTGFPDQGSQSGSNAYYGLQNQGVTSNPGFGQSGYNTSGNGSYGANEPQYSTSQYDATGRYYSSDYPGVIGSQSDSSHHARNRPQSSSSPYASTGLPYTDAQFQPTGQNDPGASVTGYASTSRQSGRSSSNPAQSSSGQYGQQEHQYSENQYEHGRQSDINASASGYPSVSKQPGKSGSKSSKK